MELIDEPSAEPSAEPSLVSTREPSSTPDTAAPSESPTIFLSQEPSAIPTMSPSLELSESPSKAPSAGPSVEPSLQPIVSVPSFVPSTSAPSTTFPTPPPIVVIPKPIAEYSDTSGGFRVIGGDGSRVGFALSMIGDYNGDGLQDFAVSANQYTYQDRTFCGLVLILLGRNSAWADIDLSAATSDTTMRRIIGSGAYQETGSTVAPAGDVNQDGFADVLVGAPYFESLGRYAAGAVFVIFGMPSTSAYTDIDLASFSAGATTGFVVYGPEVWSRLGSGGAVLHKLGDINGDSIDDFAVAAPFTSYSSRPAAGIVWFIYGTTVAPAHIDLASLAPEVGFQIGGAFDDDQFGVAVDNVGDFNGDGLADILIGAYHYDAPGTTDSGAAYLIYGITSLVGFDMRSFVTGAFGIRFLGAASGDETGKAVSGAGDINGDGKMDLLIGAPAADHLDGRVDSGAVYAIFGTTAVFTADFRLSTQMAGVAGYSICGYQSYQHLGAGISRAGDLDQDGMDDFLVGSGEGIYALYGSAVVPITPVDLRGFTGKMVALAAPGEAIMSMSGGIDLDVDGHPDILVGIPFSSLASIGMARTFAGIVYMMRGPVAPDTVAPSNRPTSAPSMNPSASSTAEPTLPPNDAPTPVPSQASTIGVPTTLAPTLPPVVIVPRSIQTYTNTSGGLRFIGASGSSTGASVSMIGDHNNDGLQDFAVVAQMYSYPSRVNCGMVVIVLGSTSKWVDIDISTATSGLTVRRIIGRSTNDQIGDTVAPGGDVNSDGYADLLIGFNDYGGSNMPSEGAIYVIFGMASTFGYTDVDLAIITASATAHGFMIVGASWWYFLGGDGAVFRALGDVNGDSIDDIAIASSRCIYQSSRFAAGCVYIIYGTTSAPAHIRLANLGTAGIMLGGAGSSNRFGYAMDNVGDFNGDGKSDFLVSAPYYSPSDKNFIGAVYLLYGTTAPVNMDMATFVTGSSGVRFLGAASYDYAGDAVSGAGDINDDGKMDLLIGVPGADLPDGRVDSGAVYVIFGTNILFPSDVNLGSVLAGSIGFAIFGLPGSSLGGTVSRGGDLNQDGIDDIIIGSTAAFYVFYGSVTIPTAHVDLLRFTGKMVVFQSDFEFGRSDAALSGGVDVDNDGVPDILVGLPKSRSGAGDAYLMRGPVVPSTASPSATPSAFPSAMPTMPVPSITPTAQPTGPPVVIVHRSIKTFTTISGGVRVFGSQSMSVGLAVRTIGDYNNDGIEDFAVSAPTYSFSWKTYCGMVVIVLGKSTAWIDIDLPATTSGLTTRRVIGSNFFDQIGNTVSVAGDVNQDGFADMLIGASRHGVVYVIFGMASTISYTDIDLASFSASAGFIIFGPSAAAKLGDKGALFRALGDINGDSIDDFAVAAPAASYLSRPGAGCVWLIYGTTAEPVNLNLAFLEPNNGVQLGGANNNDQFGYAVDNVGDFNGDGIADLLIGALWYDMPNATDSGAAYLIYGSTTPVNMDMAGFVTGALGIRFRGTASGDETGKAVSGAGDINDDGKMDLLIGAPGADHSDGRVDSGAVYAIFGTSTMFTADFVLGTLMTGASGFSVTGFESFQLLGTSVSRAGDLDQDGVDDYLIGSTKAMYVLYGSSGVPTAHIDLRSFTGKLVAFAEPDDDALAMMTGGVDVTADGIPDVIVGFPLAPFYNIYGVKSISAGVTYMMRGPVLPDNTMAPSSLPTPTSPLQPLPTASPTNAGTQVYFNGSQV